MDPNHGSPPPQPPLNSPPRPDNAPPLPHSPSPPPPPQSPVDSDESVLSDSESMRTFIIKYDETIISFKRPWHWFNGQGSAPSNHYPQPKRRNVSAPERSDSSDSSLDSDSSAKNVSPDEPSSSSP